MKTPYQTLTKPYQEKAIQLLQAWIQIPSVDDSNRSSKGKPYGEGVFQALQYIGKIAEQDGFEVDYCDGHVTEISFGKGPLIAVYAHADVVPVSDQWKHPPFGAVIEKGRMYGRGTSDDKGPGMAAYIALKALRDGGLIQGYSVKLVIGGNEEKGSNCLHYYFHTLKKPYPKAGFTPDGNFPLIYGEKGITNYELSGLVKLPLLQSIEAGTAHNAVIDLATAVLINDPTITKTLKKKRYRYTLKQEGKMMRLSIHGKAAHGSTPGIGVNAGVQLLDVLGDHYQYQPFQTLAKQYSDVYGKKLGLYVKTKLMGVTTFNVGLMSYKEGQLTMTVNYRYPETVKIKEVIAALKKISPFKVKQSYDSPLLFIDPQSPMVKTLVKVYQQETGDNKTKPMTIGGGTYAKEAKNTLAFGSKFPGRNDFIHENDEKIDLIDYTRSISIYASAIDHLGRLYAPKK